VSGKQKNIEEALKFMGIGMRVDQIARETAFESISADCRHRRKEDDCCRLADDGWHKWKCEMLNCLFLNMEGSPISSHAKGRKKVEKFLEA
jgi:hypothetical protein